MVICDHQSCSFLNVFSAFSSVEVNNIDVELHADVIMIWKFPFPLDPNITLVRVTQSHCQSLRDVIILRGGVPKVFLPYDGRVQILTQGFPDGVVAIKMNSVRFSDAGKYQCLIEKPTSEDFRFLNLKVRGRLCLLHIIILKSFW